MSSSAQGILEEGSSEGSAGGRSAAFTGERGRCSEVPCVANSTFWAMVPRSIASGGGKGSLSADLAFGSDVQVRYPQISSTLHVIPSAQSASSVHEVTPVFTRRSMGDAIVKATSGTTVPGAPDVRVTTTVG